MEVALHHVAHVELKPPLYFPKGSRICGVELTFQGGEWNVLYYAVTAATFGDVHDTTHTCGGGTTSAVNIHPREATAAKAVPSQTKPCLCRVQPAQLASSERERL